MIRLLLFLSLVAWNFTTQAQPNLYVSNNISSFHRFPIVECGSHVYFLSSRVDTLPNKMLVNSFYLSSTNKFSHQLTKSILIERDTAFNYYESPDLTNISCTVNPATKRLSVFFLTDVDSSSFATSLVRKYPKKISFMQLDSNLDVTIAARPILRDYKIGKYTLNNIAFSQYDARGGTILGFEVRDTVSSTPISLAGKLLIVDDTGKVLVDKFLGWEPEGSGQLFPTHRSSKKLCKNPDGSYVAVVQFFDSLFHFNDLTLLLLDSNLQLINKFNYPISYSQNSNGGPLTSPGKNGIGFGGTPEDAFFLPSGSFIRSARGAYNDDSIGNKYVFQGIGKAGPGKAYQPTYIYFPPPSDTGDRYHSSSTTLNSAIYNGQDNRIYAFMSTKSDEFFSYCMNGQPSLGQLAAIDTNMQERWVKYIRPRAGYCIKSSSVDCPDSRNGALVSGWEVNLSDKHNYSLWRPFIYYVDSTTSLGVNNPESPVIISDQFSLYPNPAKDHIVIENVLGTGYSYSIINSIGQQIMSAKGAGAHTQVGVQQLPPGIYLVRITAGENKIFTLRFLKE